MELVGLLVVYIVGGVVSSVILSFGFALFDNSESDNVIAAMAAVWPISMSCWAMFLISLAFNKLLSFPKTIGQKTRAAFLKKGPDHD
jgi:hypothetical protein